MQTKADRADAVLRKLTTKKSWEQEAEERALKLLAGSTAFSNPHWPCSTLAADLALATQHTIMNDEKERWQRALQIRTNQLLKQQNRLLGRIADALEKIEGRSSE